MTLISSRRISPYVADTNANIGRWTAQLRRSAQKVGFDPDTLRKWVLLAQVTVARSTEVTTAERQRIKRWSL